MIVYNVTVKVELTIAGAWLQWLKAEHIKDVIDTGCFTKAIILKLLDTDETDGKTYAIQYFAETKEHYNAYIDKYAGLMRQKGFEKWGNKFIAFRSLMQVVE